MFSQNAQSLIRLGIYPPSPALLRNLPNRALYSFSLFRGIYIIYCIHSSHSKSVPMSLAQISCMHRDCRSPFSNLKQLMTSITPESYPRISWPALRTRSIFWAGRPCRCLVTSRTRRSCRLDWRALGTAWSAWASPCWCGGRCRCRVYEDTQYTSYVESSVGQYGILGQERRKFFIQWSVIDEEQEKRNLKIGWLKFFLTILDSPVSKWIE